MNKSKNMSNELEAEISRTNATLKEALTIGQLSMHKIAWQSVSVKLFSRIDEARRIVWNSISSGVSYASGALSWGVNNLQNKEHVSSKETE